MTVNYALTRAYTFICREKGFYLPFLIGTAIINLALIPIVRSLIQLGMMGTFLVLLLSLIGIIIQVGLIYSINHKVEKGSYVSFIDSLWPGFCFAPGFVLKSIKVVFLSIVGFIFLIIPGVYMGLKHFLDPYYSIISDDSSLYTNYKFDKHNVKSAAIFIVSFAPLWFLPTTIPMWMDKYYELGFMQYLFSPLNSLISILTVAACYFYIDYVARIERKKKA